MASSVAMKLSFILLLTLVSSMKTQARDSQFFNKVSSTVSPNKEQPLNNQQQEPSFLPENDNGYGLYGHETGKLPPSATTATEPTTTATKTAEPTTTSTSSVSKEPLHKYLPKNYNPVAYVTEPENVDDSNSFSEDTYTNNLNNDENNNYNDAQNYYDNQGKQEYQTREPHYRSYTANTLTAKNRYSSNNFNYNDAKNYYDNQGKQEYQTGEPHYRSYTANTLPANNRYSNNNFNYNDAQNYYDNQGKQEYQTGEPHYRSYTANTLTANNRYSNNNFNYNGGSSFNSGPQRLSDTSFSGRENNFYNGDEESSFQPQGMSDTRSLENGKYFYDVNNEKFSKNHPYESSKVARARNQYNDRNYYGNSYQNQYEFPNEQNFP